MAGNGLKSLAKDTAIYGLSSILGRLLNWCLTPFYIYFFSDPADLGKVNALYGYTALFVVLLTYGMETGLFRFLNKDDEDASKVYPTSLISLATTSLLFIAACFCLINPIASVMEYTGHNDHILIMSVIVATDAFMTIPFAYLRYQKRPIRFMSLKMTFIISNILFNLFFLLLCPWLQKISPGLIDWFYNAEYGIGYIFVANLLSNILVFVLLAASTIKNVRFIFDFGILKRMLKYSFPLMILAVAGVISQTVAQLIYPHIFPTAEEGYKQLGIYISCLKFTVIISMFIQAFRYAYEPFIFGKNKDKDSTKSYADAMKYFIIFALLLFIGVMFYIDFIQKFILWIGGKNYIVGLDILPTAMLGEICFGIYFNLSIWYKLTDNTRYGAWFSVTGCIIQVLLNIILVPVFGYIASAWATLTANLLIMTASYFIGQKYMPIKYDIRSAIFYFGLTAIFFAAGMYIPIENMAWKLIFRTILLFIFVAIVIKKDIPLSEVPVLKRFVKKRN